MTLVETKPLLAQWPLESRRWSGRSPVRDAMSRLPPSRGGSKTRARDFTSWPRMRTPSVVQIVTDRMATYQEVYEVAPPEESSFRATEGSQFPTRMSGTDKSLRGADEEVRELRLIPASNVTAKRTEWAWRNESRSAELPRRRPGARHRRRSLPTRSQGQVGAPLRAISTEHLRQASTQPPKTRGPEHSDRGLRRQERTSIWFTSWPSTEWKGVSQSPETSRASPLRWFRPAHVFWSLDPFGAHLHPSLDTHRDSSVRIRQSRRLSAAMERIGAAANGRHALEQGTILDRVGPCEWIPQGSRPLPVLLAVAAVPPGRN